MEGHKTRTHISVVLGVFIVLLVVVVVGATIVILVLRETHVAANLPLQKLALPWMERAGDSETSMVDNDDMTAVQYLISTSHTVSSNSSR